MWTIIFFTSWQCSSFVMGNDDWLSYLIDEIQPKCEKSPPKSSANEKPISILRLTSDDWPSDPSNKSQPKCKKGPLSHEKMKCLFLDCIQILMISEAIQAMKVKQPTQNGQFRLIRNFSNFFPPKWLRMTRNGQFHTIYNFSNLFPLKRLRMTWNGQFHLICNFSNLFPLKWLRMTWNGQFRPIYNFFNVFPMKWLRMTRNG